MKVLEPGVGKPGRKGTKISSEASMDEGEKSSVYRISRPYRKPTQVGRKRILRSTGEG